MHSPGLLRRSIRATARGAYLLIARKGSRRLLGLRLRRKRPSRRRLPLRGIRSTSLTSLAPPLRRSSTILRLWKASSSTRWATLTMVAFGSSFDHDLHHLVLALLVERRGRLVEHDDVGVVQQQPREGEALLLAAGQGLVPRRLFLDLVLEMIEADLVQGLADLLDVPVLGGAGIGDRRGAACRTARKASAAA